MDGESGQAAPNGACTPMIPEHLVIPTILTIAPLVLWGVWIVSESSFDIFLAQSRARSYLTKSLRWIRPIDTESDERTIRRKAVHFIFALGLGTFWLIYLLVFVVPNFALPITLILLSIVSYGVYLLNGANRQRKMETRKFESELPTFMQLMTVLISSGISPTRALDLLTRRPQSVSARKLRDVVKDVNEGKSIVEALDTLAAQNESLILRRFTTGIILGIERGSSLTPVLIAQVKDARTLEKNKTLQKAGRAEIALMVPVVFLILPISILFALWPSYQQLGDFL